MTPQQLHALGFTVSRRQHRRYQVSGYQYERRRPQVCVFLPDDASFTEIVIGPGERPRAYFRGPALSAESIRRFLEAHLS